MGYIYKITNDLNGKMYIGKTELANPNKRWKQHLSSYKKESSKHRPLYNEMNKYGEEHFHFEVIEETNTPDESYKRERYWISELRTYVGFDDCNGYNATLGGEGSPCLNLDKDEVIEYHIYKANCLIDDTAKHFSISKNELRMFLENNNAPYLKGDSLKRFKTYIEHGGVYQIHPITKNIENIFESAVEADLYLGVNKKIANVCKYNASEDCIGHYFLDYLWFYVDDYYKYLKQILDFDINNCNRYDFNEIYEDLLKTKSITKTIYNLNIRLESRSYIYRRLKQLGYDLSILHKKRTYIVQRNKYTKEIINIFDTIRDANISLGKPIDSRNISACLSGKTKTAYGFIWEYLN